jgi:hypothetical protein
MDFRFWQAAVLRIVGVLELLAFGAVVMPRASMAATHAWLGLSEMPEAPVFDSVMRQVSYCYTMHGIATLIVASDVVRFRPLVILSAIGYLLAAPLFLAIDLDNGMPGVWLAGNGGACLVIGAVLTGLLLAERMARNTHARQGRA